jgi:hypothetical protein
MEKEITWKMSPRLISYFASYIYSGDISTIAIREALQNSADANSKNFKITLIDNRNIVIENDGTPMTLDVIEKQLFVLGESTKTQGEQCGYFGVGECAIIAPCENWKIETGNIIVENFKVKDTDNYVKGTKHTLTFKEAVKLWKIREFLEFYNGNMKITIKDQFGEKQLKLRNLSKCRKFAIPNGTFTWIKSGEDKTVIRVKGIPQTITRRWDNCGTWIIDLDSSTLLSVSREQVRDETTNNAIERISETIRQINEHVSGDEPNEWVTLSENPKIIRKKGFIVRADISSARVQKIFKCLEVVDNWYKQKISEKTTNIEFKHSLGLAFTDKDILAFVKDNTIYINVQDRKINPPTTFALCLIDDYTHELAHIYGGYAEHEKLATTYRRIAYENPEIYETLRKLLRY